MPSIVIPELLARPDFQRAVDWRRRPFAAGEVIVQEGQLDRSLILIEEGSADVFCDVWLEDHRHIRPGIWVLGPGDLFGELVLFDQQPRAASVVARSPGRVVAIDADSLQAFLDDRPDVGYRLLKELFTLLTERLRRANQRLESVFAWGLRAHGIDRHI
jgi:CRP-like cAMP-binding protein